MQVERGADVDAVLRALPLSRPSPPVRRIAGTDIHIIDAGTNAGAVAAALASDPRVRFAEPDYRIPPALVSTDPLSRRQHYLATIGAPHAWNVTTGDGRPIAILDSGVDATHPDLFGRVLPGWNTFDENADADDVTGHGTLVAGVAAATADNATGGTGVTWINPILPVRVTDPDGNAYYSTLAAGLVWAADHGARIANLSFAVYGGQALNVAAQYFVGHGGLVFAAGGNDGRRHDVPPNPWVISVAATGRGRLTAPFSSRGAYIDVAAPGTNILTTARGGGYARASGTSLACPIAAAVAALVMAANPALDPAEVEAIIERDADDLGQPGFDPDFGWGRVNAARAVEAARAR